jgi:nickel-dependent lactate racemase
LEEPLGSPGLDDFLRGREKVLIVVNDATRPTPTAEVLEAILPNLAGRRLQILVATGSHRPPTDGENRWILGKHYDALKGCIHVHDAKQSDRFVLGKTRYGNELTLNRLVREADAVIPIGSIEPHYFAGYTGGRKSFMPGLAGYDTITANHRLAISPAAQALVLEGNPVAEELDDAEELLNPFPIFSIMTVLDGHGGIYAAAAGDLGRTFRSLLARADDVFVVPVSRRAEIVVTIARAPNDIDLYQSQKALDNGKTALKEGGIIILVSACRSGIGSRVFLDLLGSESTCQAVVAKLDREYRLGYHKAGKMAEIGIKSKMWAVTPLDRNLIEQAKMRPFASVSQALAEAFRIMGPQARALFIMDGGLTIPRLESGGNE